jgi:transposase InsO family protein
MEDDRQMDLALWRYGIISPLLHRDANDVQLCEMLIIVSTNSYIHPSDRRHVTISAEAIRKWLYRFNHGGLSALRDKQRTDKGDHNVPTPIIDEMFGLRQAHPRWTVALILRELVVLKLWDETQPSRSTLYRFARDNNLMRDPHLGAVEVVRPFEFEKFGQMWTADFMHGPKLYMGKKKCKCYLHVIIDDCTRYVVSGRFYPSETTQSLISELMTAVRRHGIAQRLYTDNGSAYNSRHLKIVCANLSMQHPRTPPRRPQGRSKVERFFRTVREQFLAKRKYKTFDEINSAFIQYLNDYHHRIHSTLECSPMQKRLSVGSVCQHVPEVADIESLFRLKRRCRVYNDQTIRLHKKAFEVPGCLPGSRVTIYYMPWNLSRVYYGEEMQLAKPVDLSANAYRFDNPSFSHTKETTDAPQ